MGFRNVSLIKQFNSLHLILVRLGNCTLCVNLRDKSVVAMSPVPTKSTPEARMASGGTEEHYSKSKFLKLTHKGMSE